MLASPFLNANYIGWEGLNKPRVLETVDHTKDRLRDPDGQILPFGLLIRMGEEETICSFEQVRLVKWLFLATLENGCIFNNRYHFICQA